jgi:hypothetical protein
VPQQCALELGAHYSATANVKRACDGELPFLSRKHKTHIRLHESILFVLCLEKSKHHSNCVAPWSFHSVWRRPVLNDTEIYITFAGLKDPAN